MLFALGGWVSAKGHANGMRVVYMSLRQWGGWGYGLRGAVGEVRLNDLVEDELRRGIWGLRLWQLERCAWLDLMPIFSCEALQVLSLSRGGHWSWRAS